MRRGWTIDALQRRHGKTEDVNNLRDLDDTEECDGGKDGEAQEGFCLNAV